MISLGHLIETIGANPLVVGLLAIFSIFGAMEFVARYVARGARIVDIVLGRRDRSALAIDNGGVSQPPTELGQLVRFVGSSIACLTILGGGLLVYQALTAVDFLRAEFGAVPPREIWYATAFASFLELILGVSIIFVASSVGQRFKSWASRKVRTEAAEMGEVGLS